MKVDSELRAWLLRSDPIRPDVGGVNRKHREERLKKIEELEEAELEKMLADPMRYLGGPGSGNFGHAGRPGQIGGSAPASGGSSWIGRPSTDYPPSRPDGLDTRERFSDGKGHYTPERSALHEEIIEKMIRGRTTYKGGPKDGQPRPAPVPVSEPTATVLGGAPGVGKSTIVNSTGIGYENTVTVSVDDIRDELPEFAKDPVTGKQPASIAFTHEEASDISAKMIKRLGNEKYNMVLDGTGDSKVEKLGGKVAVMRQRGAKVVGTYVTTTLEITQQRADARGAKIGRMVPPSVTKSMHRAIGETFPEALRQGLFDEASLFDSSESVPRLIVSAKGRELTVHNQELWNDFLKRGKD